MGLTYGVFGYLGNKINSRPKQPDEIAAEEYGGKNNYGNTSENVGKTSYGKSSENVGKGGSKYVKASLWERIRTKTAKVGDINPNPLDEFSNPQIGPNESAVSRYIKEINTNVQFLNQ